MMRNSFHLFLEILIPYFVSILFLKRKTSVRVRNFCKQSGSDNVGTGGRNSKSVSI